MKKLQDVNQLNYYMKELMESEALELLRCPAISPTDLYIPYMMNDAVEYYLVLKDCVINGEISGEFGADTSWELQTATSKSGDRNVLVLRRSDGTFVTLAFSSLEMSIELYQYHRIGHFWVKEQELWRRLVYVIGTINDKKAYLGDEFCNEAEEKLIPLMGFGPFRYWSPIRESIQDYYEESIAGWQTFKEIAEAAKDKELVRKLQQYRKRQTRARWLKCFGRDWAYMDRLDRLMEEMACEITKQEHRSVYQLICDMVDRASSSYKERDYGKERNLLIRDTRERLQKRMEELGYAGSYPLFHKKSSTGNEEFSSQRDDYVIAYEEHPFIIEELDYEDFGFRIHLVTDEGNVYRKQAWIDGEGNILCAADIMLM